MHKVKVSIVMPCFNAGKYIINAIESVLIQDVSFQLIIINDGSTDDTADVLDQYRDHIVLIDSDHVGVANARNQALRYLQGDYTLLLDADDSLEPGALTVLLSSITCDRQVAYGRFSSWDSHMQSMLHIHKAGRLSPNPFVFLSRGNFTPPGSLLFPSTVFNEVGNFDQEVAGCEDWDFLVRIARAGYAFKPINQPVFRYRRHMSSASNQASKMYDSGVKVIQRCYKTDPRLSLDCYPQGNTLDDIEGNIIRFCASCFALAALSGDTTSAGEMIRQIGAAGTCHLKQAGVSFRTGLWWYGMALKGDRKKNIYEGMSRAVEIIEKNINDLECGKRIMGAFLYPDLAELFMRSGPKKAVRLVNEWLEARKLINAAMCNDRRVRNN